MGSTKALLFAGVVALGAVTAAQAADLPPPPPMLPPPPAPMDTSGWYIRGDVGVGIADSPDIRSTFFDGSGNVLSGATLANTVPSFARVTSEMGDSAFVDLGIGYQVNNWLRFDATGEYRTSQHLGTVEAYDAGFFVGLPGNLAYDQYNGTVQSSVFLANAYIDLGTWWCITPFIGAGVGTAYNRVISLSDVGVGGPLGGIGNGGFGYAKEHDSFDLAYAAMAGVSYAVTPNLKLELAYRYLNMGDAQSGVIHCVNSTGCVLEKHTYGLSSQDIKLGMRWMFADTPISTDTGYEPPPPSAPIVRKF